MPGLLLWIGTLVLGCIVALPTTARAEGLDSATRRNLQIEVQRSRAAVMNPAVITPSERFARPADPVDRTARPDEPPMPEDPGTPAQSLTPGQLYHVALSPRREAQAAELLREHVASSTASTGDDIMSFSGVVRQVSENNVEVSLKPYVLVGQRLRFVPELQRFVGSVAVGVMDLFNSGGNTVLSAPLKFQAIESQELKVLNHLSPPFEYFKVSTAASGKPVTLRIASNFSHEGVSVTVPVEPTLIVEIENPNLRGMGLQRTNVKIRAVGWTTAPGGEVSLVAPGAFLDEEPAMFDEHGVARSGLRSDSSGEVTLTASATGYVAGTKTVNVTWPWRTLITTCIGGVVGGFIRLGPRIRRGMNGLKFMVGLAISALTGLLVFALYIVGVKVLPVAFSVDVGDVFAFAAAALGGWFGSAVLPSLRTVEP